MRETATARISPEDDGLLVARIRKGALQRPHAVTWLKGSLE
jgi:hypothetical protein